ncbi:nicotinate-nucleotide pyrophosphorylase [Trichonephila inaurata madagascariensis]|uniref:Nicotinate-nucleotide pyrophosphorylase [carboxylating] n=1 Tax=Trichonephila inaurata madagascariensis TaxID=2747483 RepID=A0A8X6WXT6_9ARAC|nr:nicotinate-nucleotide pyrophosphorylase [Trichonephila inaurata madagascariensis]
MCEGVLHPLRLQNLVREWLLEDTSSFDFGGGVVGDRRCEFTIYMKSSGVLAGIPFVNALFRELNLQVTWLQKEGDRLNPITEIAKVYGPAKSLLLAERLALNILSRASGVATAAARLGDIVRQAHWHGTVSGSRKTTPGFRMVEKYALIVGGVDTHRYDLSSMVMLKDNHISLSGSIEEAVLSARRLCGFALKIEVECRSLPEALEACRANCDVVMLDNFEPEECKRAALTLKLQYPNVLVEVSGGITEENILSYANPWTDILSSSSLVQGYPTLDFSMKVTPTRGIAHSLDCLD